MDKHSTLAIETSCDDTSIWIINFDWKFFSVSKLLAYSQVKEHNEFGGVVPEIASRLHSEKIIAVLKSIWRSNIKEVDTISITSEPWLPWSLVVGKTVANLLWTYFQKPVINVNHIVWHVFALFLEKNIEKIQFPMILLTASGGHNNIYHIDKQENNVIGSVEYKWWDFIIKQIGKSLDDAAGECFDKVSRMLGGPYPGGVWIWEQAKKWKSNKKYELNRVWLSNNEFNFSFSGVKSQVNNLIEKWNITKNEIPDVAYEFQESVVEVLAKKLIRAGLKYNAKTIGLSWWVSANDRLQEYILELLDNQQWLNNQIQDTDKSKKWWKCEKIKIDFIIPSKKVYCTDNAAMIGVAGILKQK